MQFYVLSKAKALRKCYQKPAWNDSISDLSKYVADESDVKGRKYNRVSKNNTTATVDYQQRLEDMRKNLWPYILEYRVKYEWPKNNNSSKSNSEHTKSCKEEPMCRAVEVSIIGKTTKQDRNKKATQCLKKLNTGSLESNYIKTSIDLVPGESKSGSDTYEENNKDSYSNVARMSSTGYLSVNLKEDEAHTISNTEDMESKIKNNCQEELPDFLTLNELRLYQEEKKEIDDDQIKPRSVSKKEVDDNQYSIADELSISKSDLDFLESITRHDPEMNETLELQMKRFLEDNNLLSVSY